MGFSELIEFSFQSVFIFQFYCFICLCSQKKNVKWKRVQYWPEYETHRKKGSYILSVFLYVLPLYVLYLILFVPFYFRAISFMILCACTMSIHMWKRIRSAFLYLLLWFFISHYFFACDILSPYSIRWCSPWMVHNSYAISLLLSSSFIPLVLPFSPIGFLSFSLSPKKNGIRLVVQSVLVSKFNFYSHCMSECLCHCLCARSHPLFSLFLSPSLSLSRFFLFSLPIHPPRIITSYFTLLVCWKLNFGSKSWSSLRPLKFSIFPLILTWL